MVPYMVKIFVSLVLMFAGMQAATADQCQETACINVYTENNQIIIEARKGNTTVKKTIAQAPKKVVVKATPAVGTILVNRSLRFTVVTAFLILGL